MRLAIKGHDTANYEGEQIRWILTSELSGLSSFGILFPVTMWTCVVLLVWWPQSWQITDRIWLCRGQIVIGHLAPAAWGVTKVLGWCHWWFREGRSEGHDWSG